MDFTLKNELLFKSQEYKKKYGEQENKLKDTRIGAAKIAFENEEFDMELAETNVELFERRHIDEDISNAGVLFCLEILLNFLFQQLKIFKAFVRRSSDKSFRDENWLIWPRHKRKKWRS